MPELLKRAHLEVERKFRIDESIAKVLPDSLSTFGFKQSSEIFMTDTFLPTREPGEMLRVREENVKTVTGVTQRNVLTSKRWVVFPDGGKEREEVEEEIGPLARLAYFDLGLRLNGGPLSSFSKQRVMYDGKLGAYNCVISIDHVENIGTYSGFYVEIEVLADPTEDLKAIKQLIVEMAGKLLGPSPKEAGSYMEMLRLSKQQ